MARKPDGAAVLAEKMVAVLEAQRTQGSGAYPISLERLREHADAQATPEQALKALGKKPLTDRAAAAPKKSPSALVVLREDVVQLAESPQLLELLLEATCTPARPAVPASSLKSKLDPALKKPFEDAVERRIQAQDWPAGVACQAVGKRALLYLTRMPPPRKPEVELAERLVRVLEAQRGLGTSYPLTLRQLLDLASPGTSLKLTISALGSEPFASKAQLGLKSPRTKPNFEGPVALREDHDKLAASPLLLQLALRAARTKSSQVAAVAALAKKIADGLGRAFTEAVSRQLESDRLPPEVGWLLIGGKKQLFLLADAHLGSPSPTVAPAPAPPTNFGHVFDAAFQRLDRAAGGHNFVNLAALRREVPADRATFDRELHRLRLAGRYTLSGAEGRHGLTAEEKEAGILEEGCLLLFVSRRMG